ncbi:hypothetical protein [Streptomyces torulosus]|uniref:hypothetical protein n=1 Tax=Streptomyces torulosus TaxID=68276 RepID=UPI0006EBB406|nr:hypothetical protein [Streptomyces torulosus]
MRSAREAAQLGAFGMQSLACGVLGEYLLGVFRQVQGRPPYLVMERIDSGHSPALTGSSTHVEERS